MGSVDGDGSALVRKNIEQGENDVVTQLPEGWPGVPDSTDSEINHFSQGYPGLAGGVYVYIYIYIRIYVFVYLY